MLKENIYLYYVAFQFFLFMMLLSASGYGYYFLWQNNPFINELIMKHFDDLALIFAVLFSKSFLQTKLYYPTIDKILNIFLVLLFIVLITTGYIHLLLVKPVMIGVILIIFFTSIVALIEHKSKIKYYFTGWLFMIVGSLLMLSQNFGWVEPSFLTNWSLYIASMFEAILFSMALAQKIELLKQEKKEALKINQDRLEYEVKRKTLNLDEALKQKEILLKEIHHRVKNNLQIISSFITIAMLKNSDIQIRDIFTSLQDRINAVSLLHEYLYKHENLDLINIKEYIYNLVNQIATIYIVKNIKFDFNIDDIRLEFDRIILLGLIINEVVTNSLKYAFKNTPEPRIKFKLKNIKEDKFYLEIIDNGCGFDTDIDLKKSKTLGLKMIHRLTTKQLNGELTVKSKAGKTSFTILF
jgi:two-component sensor histidine kinase